MKIGTLAITITMLYAVSALADEKPWYAQCPATIKNSHECAQYIERAILKKYPSVASRDKDLLVLVLESGETKILVNKYQTADDTLYYNLSDVYRDIGYALVHGQYYEGSTYFLVNLRTGHVEDISGRPVLSPGRVYLASANFGGVSGYTKPVVKIYRLTKPHLTLEWSLEPPWEPSDPKWVTDTSLSIVKNVFSPELHGKFQYSTDWYLKKKILIVRKNNKWILLEKQ